MSDIPPEDLANEDVPEIEKLFENLAVHVHLGNYQLDQAIIGWAHGWRNKEDGTSTLVINLDEEASEKLGDLTEIFKLYAIGFVGREHLPGEKQDDRSPRDGTGSSAGPDPGGDQQPDRRSQEGS
jgi:hypothetical protein